VRRAAARRCHARVLVALMLPLSLAGLTRLCSRTSHVHICCPKCKMDAEVAGLTGGGVGSATTRSVLGRHGWGALSLWPAVLAGPRFAWSEVAMTQLMAVADRAWRQVWSVVTRDGST
jgi:hypothetical protein